MRVAAVPVTEDPGASGLEVLPSSLVRQAGRRDKIDEEKGFSHRLNTYTSPTYAVMSVCIHTMLLVISLKDSNTQRESNAACCHM